MTDRFTGDPLINIDENGADITFTEGQPVMDSGFNNQVIISLFSDRGWWGNDVMNGRTIGSDYETKGRGAITLQTLNDIRQAGISALQYDAFNQIDATISNPTATTIIANFLISPPGGDILQLLFTKNGINWINQGSQKGADNGL